MSNKGKWLNNIGRIIKKKNGGFFMVFERQKDKNKQYKGEDVFPLTINEGDIFQLRPKREDMQALIDGGFVDEATVDKICESVRFEINRAPQDREESDQGKKQEPSGKKNNKSGVDF